MGGKSKNQSASGYDNFVQVLDLPMPKSARLRKARDVFAATSHANWEIGSFDALEATPDIHELARWSVVAAIEKQRMEAP